MTRTPGQEAVKNVVKAEAEAEEGVEIIRVSSRPRGAQADPASGSQ